MNEFCAAMGICNLENIQNGKVITARKQITKQYLDLLSSVEGIKCFNPINNKNYIYNYSYFPILIQKGSRDSIYNYLKDNNIYTRKYFYPLISNIDCYKRYTTSKLEVANEISNKILVLPIYFGLKQDEVNYITEMIKQWSKITV